ncbi:MAG: PAS domain-containing protein [Bauldia sp.]|nr:PAS domain-containing protein [Bauldia sp.]
MIRQGHAYLDLTALPETGAVLLDPRPAFLWAEDGSRILWANAAGVHFLGAPNVHALLQRRFGDGNPVGLQVAAAMAATPAGEPQMTVIRFPVQGATEPVLCLGTRVPLDEDGDALLLSSLQPPARVEPLLGRAFGLAAAIAEDDIAAVVLRPDGRIVGASEGFREVSDGPAALGALAASTAASGRRMLKRRIVFGGEKRLVGLAAVATPEGPFVLALVGPAEAGDAIVAPIAPTAPANEDRNPRPATVEPLLADDPEAPPPPVIDDLAAPAVVGQAQAEPVPAAAGETKAPEVAADAVSVEAPTPDAAEAADAAPDTVIEATARSGGAAAGAAASPAVAARQPLPTPANAAFAFFPRPAPVRFVFQIDPDRRFTQVSPELATVVGPRRAAIVGRSWLEVAQELGLGAADLVERALSRRDTWSGITVYWPIQDSSEAVAVDLAALPAFSRSGTFEGFRGFGVCRTSDIRRDLPEETAPDAPAPALESAAPAAPPVAEPPAIRAEPAAAAAAPENDGSNIVHLPSTGKSRALNGNEQDAFRRIADALRSIAPRRPADSPATGPQPPATAADPAGPVATSPVPATVPLPAATTAPAPEAVPLRFLDRLPVGFAVFRDRAILFANRALLDRLGFADTRALADAGGIDGLFATNTGGEERRRILLRAGDGSDVVAEVRLHVVPWTDGPATMLSVRTDPEPVVDRKFADDQQAALIRIDELEAVLDTATDGVVVIDVEARVMSLNRSAEALFGVEATDILGRSFTELLAPESRKAALDYVEGLTKNGVASVLNDGREMIGRTPGGGLIPLFVTMGRLGDSGKFCAVLRDITQWKNAEDELITARRAAEVASQQKSEFLAKISHEIRTPLNAVIGFSEVMLEERFGPIGNERYREYLKDIRLSGSHLMSLINDLLDLSKIEAGKADLAFAAVPVNEIMQECVALMQPEANRRRIIIRTSLAAAVPKVVADARSLRQIVLNLLSNAVKFTPAGGQVIVSTALEDNGEVVVRIRDTGIGMSDKDLETALKPFRQLNTSNPNRVEGTGLGLPLTKALVEANRAVFAIDSKPNQGTMARITFPTSRVLSA